MRSILNKLTPEVFPLLVKQVSELKIDREEHLRGVAAIIHEKAIAEGKFTTIYTHLCHCLREINVPSKESPGVAINLRLVLLKLCQAEFQKLGEGTLANSVNGHRQRSIGNIRFIGDLFKLEMLKVTVIHNCISKLFYNKSEDALECLCCLLSTVGQKLDSEKHLLDEYFFNVTHIIKEGRTSPRIQFLLQDVLELRTNNWFCRRGDPVPKTIRQDLRVHEEPHPAWRRSCLLTEERPNSEKVWKPEVKRLTEGGLDRREEDPEAARTQELYKNMFSVLDRLAPQIFRHLIEEVNKFPINTEERLRGIAALIFEKAISEERSVATCAKMCHCLRELHDDDKMEEGQHQRSIRNMRLIGELFKLRMVKETVMHNCINKLLNMQSDVALESLYCLLSIIGNILDCDENYWFPIKAELGYRLICQLSTEAKMENMQERIEEQQQLVPSSDCNRPGGQHLALWQSIQLQDEGQNTPSHLVKMTSNPATTSSCSQALNRQEGTWRGHCMEQELGSLSSSTLNLLPALLLSSPFTCSLNMLFDRTNCIQDSAEVFNQFKVPESLSSDYSKLEVLGPETHALLTLPALPAPANPAGAMNTLSNPAPAMLATNEDELGRVAKPTEMKRLLLCVQDTNCTLQLLIVEQKSIKSNPAGQENEVIVIHRLVKLAPPAAMAITAAAGDLTYGKKQSSYLGPCGKGNQPVTQRRMHSHGPALQGSVHAPSPYGQDWCPEVGYHLHIREANDLPCRIPGYFCSHE
ncbi:hypothetical protein SKAU_G00409830 [Synaphobranchus kaupii]|uniref:MIF4G domain-containing protein n=1 Tax=Synaphobranchus kaupii TaxID=118154 RepID=A0A9Q1E7H3_SYNKA|nr:hypothetical protein SKAU_G00409830 [Synaphobranchus kaupii]